MPNAARPFDFAAGTIYFGSGVAADLARHVTDVAGGGRPRLVVVTGGTVERHAGLLDTLHTFAQVESVAIAGEPTTDQIEVAAAIAREVEATCVVGLGGGAALDSAKAVAALATNIRPIHEYLEVVGLGRPLTEGAVPVIAVPTTSGTGSEVTKNAVLTSAEYGQKVSLRHSSMLPRVAVVDPELTLGVPQRVTAATGLDALAQCIEPYVSTFANPMTDATALAGMAAGARGLRAAFTDGADLDARSDMSFCSLMGGLSLANAKLGAVHGFAGPIGGSFDAPHGEVCGRLLPLVVEMNIRGLQRRGLSTRRFDVVACTLTGRPDATALDSVEWLGSLVQDFDVPTLSDFGMDAADVDDLVKRSAGTSSMRGNPLALDPDELAAILLAAL